jgi:LPXTG-motif cell wall-anchored protein
VVATPAVTTTCSTITVDVTGFLPSSSADTALEAVGGGTSSPLGAIAVSATTATGTATFNIPTSFPVGPANVLVTGTDMIGKAVSKAVPVTIDACGSVTPSVTPTAPPSTTGTLPVTGSDSGRLIGIGAGLIVLGGAAVYGSLRSRRNPI